MRISDWSSYVCSSVLAGWLPGGGRPDRAWFHQPCRALASHAVGARVLVIDNYDSFVFNLVQYLGELGAEPDVVRNDEIALPGVYALDPDAQSEERRGGKEGVRKCKCRWWRKP